MELKKEMQNQITLLKMCLCVYVSMCLKKLKLREKRYQQISFVLSESANDGWKGDIANANGSVTMIRDFIAGEDDFFLSLLGITYKAGEDLETSGDKTYLVYSDCKTSTVLV